MNGKPLGTTYHNVDDEKMKMKMMMPMRAVPTVPLRLGRMTSSLLILLFGCFVKNASSIESLTPDEFYNLKDLVDAVVDVRGQDEWDRGHIEGAMFVEALSSYETDYKVTTPVDLTGCEYCDIIVYCRSGARAGRALQIMEDAGFKGRLYNGEGVSQWTAANYTLVTNSPSIEAPCTKNGDVSDQCYMKWLSHQTPEKVIVLQEKVYEANDSSSSAITGSALPVLFIVGVALPLFLSSV